MRMLLFIIIISIVIIIIVIITIIIVVVCFSVLLLFNPRTVIIIIIILFYHNSPSVHGNPFSFSFLLFTKYIHKYCEMSAGPNRSCFVDLADIHAPRHTHGCV